MDKLEIAKELSGMGLKSGDIVLLHSSLVSLGQVEGGPEAVVEAFMSVLGPEGTLAVPAFGALGIIAEVVKHHPQVVFSDAPVGTVAAIGAKAEEICRGHWQADTAHGHGTPYMRIAEMNGYICLLGVDQDRNTTLHTVEALAELPYLSDTTHTFKVDGKEITKTWKYYPGPHRNFIGVDKLLGDAGLMKIARIGNAQVRLMPAQEVIELLVSFAEEDPALFLCDNPSCADCVRQRAAIFADQMEQESFTLTASSQLAGRYIPEMIENLRRCGVKNIELDYVQGRACAQMSVDALKRAVDELTAAGITVTGLRVPAVPASPEKLVSLVTECGIKRVILPMAYAGAAAKALNAAGIAVSFANICQSALLVKEEMTKFREEMPAGLTFNPANFAIAGEMPFLQSYKIGRCIKFIEQLDIVDGKWDGEITRLAKGNAEIRELISILKCSNFSGYFCLGGGKRYPGTLEEAVKEFQQIRK